MNETGQSAKKNLAIGEANANKYRREFCKKVLQLYYDLSSGSSWVLVFRQQVAEHLGIADRDEFKLLSAVTYLDEKGFLKWVDNTREQITALGIDEVENGFPTLSLPRSTPLEPEEILELTPELYGIRLNLKVLWRRVRNFFGKR